MTLKTLRTPIYILIIVENPITAAHNTYNSFVLIYVQLIIKGFFVPSLHSTNNVKQINDKTLTIEIGTGLF